MPERRAVFAVPVNRDRRECERLKIGFPRLLFLELESLLQVGDALPEPADLSLQSDFLLRRSLDGSPPTH